MVTRNESQRVLIHHPEPLLAAGIFAALRRLAGFEVFLSDSTTDSTHVARVIVCSLEASLPLIADSQRQGARVVVVAHKARDFEIQRALEIGALGYIVASCSIGELESAVRAASQGLRFLCQASAQEVANGLSGIALTAREREVLILLAKGRCNKTIANHLDIGVGTVKAHVRGIMGKLQATSRTEAANIAVSRGLLPEPTVDEPAAPTHRRSTAVALYGEAASA